MINSQERTQDIYEIIPDYPKPPSVPLADPDDRTALTSIGIKPGRTSFDLANLAMKLTGFRSFQRQLPGQLDDLLRRENLRGPGLFAPIIAATLALADDPRNPDPIERAASLLFAARSLHDDVMSATLPPDTLRGQVLEMGQYPNLFSTSLIVEDGKPRIYKSRRLDRIIVAIAGRYYLLEIGDLSNDTSFSQVVEALHQIVAQAKQNPLGADEISAGLLTCATAKTQIKAFSQMQQVEVNAQSLQTLRDSFFILCLDLDSEPRDYAEAAYLTHRGNPENRWYNASLQLVVFGNAKASAICNFNAYIDGNTMMRGASEIQKRAAQVVVTDTKVSNSPPLPPARNLQWSIPPAALQQAEKDLNWVTDDQPSTFTIPDIGSDFFRENGLAAVPTFVIALQMAARRLTGRTAGIAQFLSMSRYCCMGVLTEIVTTPEVERFVLYLTEDQAQLQEKWTLLRAAIDSQAQVAREKRKHLPLREVLSLYVTSKQGWRWVWVMGVLAVTVMVLRLMGKYENDAPDIIASHPAIFPEVPIVGRPGIRLPYARDFGLHYQIWQDRTEIVMMPGLQWQFSNEEVVAAIRESLQQLKAIAEQVAATDE